MNKLNLHNEFLIITDKLDKNRGDLQILNSLVRQLHKYGLVYAGVEQFSNEQLRELTKQYWKFERKNFDKYFDGLTNTVSIDTLLKYSEHENPELHLRLIKENFPKEIAPQGEYWGKFHSLLWDEYPRRFHQQDTLHLNVVAFDMIQAVIEGEPTTNILTVLFSHIGVSPDMHSGNGTLKYHSVGRGFYGFGCGRPINSDLWQIVIPVAVVGNESIEIKNAFAREIFNHEWCERRYDLKDHYDLDPSECVMVPKPSIKTLIDIALMDKGLYFCGKCAEKVR